MPEKKDAQKLREIVEKNICKIARDLYDTIYTTRLEPAASKGQYLEVIASDEYEMKNLQDNNFRAEVIRILKVQGFEVTEHHSRDDVSLTIKWILPIPRKGEER